MDFSEYQESVRRTLKANLEDLSYAHLNLVPSLKPKPKEEKPDFPETIPDIIQGEIAQLPPRFKICLDPANEPHNETLNLLCELEYEGLPKVPKLYISMHREYPLKSPGCFVAVHKYEATEFLQRVRKNLGARIKILPKPYTLSHLLDQWEMSVRQACGSRNDGPVNQLALLMGL